MKDFIRAVCVLLVAISVGGCSLLPIALSAAASYGIYQATRK